MRIAIVAPSGRFAPEAADRVIAVAAAAQPDVELVFHPQCFAQWGHFAGTDQERMAALVEVANDSAFNAVWFARGGYGACRIAADAVAAMSPAARDKMYMGYSDGGYLLAALYRAGFPRLAHAPIPQDVMRDGGAAAIARTLAFAAAGDAAALEPGLNPGVKHAAFNITVLGLLLGTDLEPDLADHVLLLEDVAEHAYRTDRAMFHITGQERLQGLRGIRLGRLSAVPDNDPEFGATGEEIVRHWCARSAIPYLGLADIGHDADNKVVPFGALTQV